MKIRLDRIARGALLSAIAIVFLSGGLHAQGRPASVEVAPVEFVDVSETTRVFGQVVAERESLVAARVAGIAADVPIQVGSRVASGDVLARLDTELFELEIARAETELTIAEAGVQVADARLERARKAWDRAESLRVNSTIADATLEERQSALAEAYGVSQEALARLAAAQNVIDRARYDLRNATVRAPFDGIVLDVSTQVGQFVSSGSEVAMLLDIRELEVRANVPSNLITALRPEWQVSGLTGSGAELELSVRTILPTEYTTTQSRPVLLEILNTDEAVAVGQSVSVDFPVSAPRQAMVVPKDALVQSRGGWSVFVNEGGTAAPRSVEIGAAVGSGFEVVSGLQAGDVVVTRGNERLRPGQPIAPTNAPRQPDSGASAPATPAEGTPAEGSDRSENGATAAASGTRSEQG